MSENGTVLSSPTAIPPAVTGSGVALSRDSHSSTSSGSDAFNASNTSSPDLLRSPANPDDDHDDASPDSEPVTTNTKFDPHRDARDFIRLIQCSQCSYPLRLPVTLPCGNSLCRSCLPRPYRRENITYPLTEGRLEGFKCPFLECGQEHSLGDCGLDVTLTKLVEVMASLLLSASGAAGEATLLLEEIVSQALLRSSAMDIMPRSRVASGGRLGATYAMSVAGELHYHSELAYTPAQDADELHQASDRKLLQSLADAVRPEFDCQLCYSLVLDPVTTSCGHTFCRKCVARALDHSNLCPTCRRVLAISPGALKEPNNKRLFCLIEGFCPDALVARTEAAAAEDVVSVDSNRDVPLFVCTLSFPRMPTFLHIFEPRYRLMMRRAIESGGRKFGMVTYNRSGQSQGSLGNVNFMQYGTLLRIESFEMLPDGRSLIETVGVSRFKVLTHRVQDGYVVGDIERVEDVSIPEEEDAEARETSSVPQVSQPTGFGPTPDPPPTLADFDRLSTQALLQIGLNFVAKGRSSSATWLHERVLSAYGEPPTDPAIFPYWFASVLPITEDERYKLLPSTSVRERLKITAAWIWRLEAVRA